MNLISNDNSEIIMSNILNQILIYYIYINTMIFNLFKSKPSLKELIPQGFVDIHSHILPGIDDGAKNVEESLELISEMKNMKFSKIIATPHTYPGLYNNTNLSIETSYKNLISRLTHDLEINFSSEYMLDESLIEKANKRTLLCLKDNYVLFELGFINAPNNIYEIIFELQRKNYKLILAHPERYLYLYDSHHLNELKKRGIFFQLNLLSVTGYYGHKVFKFSEYLLKNNLIDFCGTDIHSLNQVKEIENSKVKSKQINQINKMIEANTYFR